MEHLKPLAHVIWRKVVGVVCVRSGWEARGLLDTGSLWTLSGWSCQLIPQGKGRGCWQVCVCVAYHLDCSSDVEKVCFWDKKAFVFELKCSCELCTEPCKWMCVRVCANQLRESSVMSQHQWRWTWFALLKTFENRMWDVRALGQAHCLLTAGLSLSRQTLWGGHLGLCQLDYTGIYIYIFFFFAISFPEYSSSDWGFRWLISNLPFLLTVTWFGYHSICQCPTQWDKLWKTLVWRILKA